MVGKHDKDKDLERQEQDYDHDVAEHGVPEHRDLHESAYEYNDEGEIVAAKTVSGETVPVGTAQQPEVDPEGRTAEDVDATQAEKAAVPSEQKDVNQDPEDKKKGRFGL